MGNITYTASPTLLKFHLARHELQVRIVRGVPASGKSVGCLLEILYMAHEQPPNKDNVRKTRFLVVRATYPRLRTTTIKTFQEWFPPEVWTLKQTAPISANARYALNDGTTVQCEVLFMSLETAEDADALKSLELTGVYINEGHEVAPELIQVALERTRRYPRKDDGGGYFGAVCFIDTNTPTQGHWMQELENNMPEKWGMFVQPPPLLAQRAPNGDIVGWQINPDAENLDNLPGGADYYLDRADAMSTRELDQGVFNRYGMHFSGKPVYDDYFLQGKHVLPTEVSPSMAQVFVGIDSSGLHPAAVFGQVIHGSLVVQEELIAADTPLQIFVDDILGPFVRQHYNGHKLLFLCDPSNTKDSRTGVTPVQTLQAGGYTAQAAKTNKFLPRREAVVHFLSKTKGLYISPSCTILIEGFNGGYHYKKMNVISVQGARYSPEPDKSTSHSDVHDALQYLCLHLKPSNQAPVVPGENAGWRKNLSSRLV